jgi:hypothetical protein
VLAPAGADQEDVHVDGLRLRRQGSNSGLGEAWPTL